jgi:outer membrane protein assembly factor BamB
MLRPRTMIAIAMLLASTSAVALAQARGNGAVAIPGLPPLPQAITSFGAAVEGDWVYVYGGHIGRAHAHSTENLSDGFHRLNLRGRGARWESLPMSTKIQGLAAVAHAGKFYRVGGLSMRNAPGETEDMHSVDEVARFDPATGEWALLAPLPEPRSSHDAAVLDGRLYVIGGWRLAGESDTATWAERGYVADLRVAKIEWKPLPPQPFRHRALAVAATSKRIYAIGGLNAEGRPTDEVHIFDPASQTWSRGPDLPTATRAKAFAASAFGVGDAVWASAIDGRVYRLDEGASQWTDSEYDLKSPRFFHRIAPHGDQSLLFIAGANRDGHLADVERVELATLRAAPLEKVSSATAPPAHAAGQSGSDTWPGFRGRGDSHTGARNLPVQWSDENVAWRASIPGYGQSSPVIWRGRAFVTSVQGPMQQTLHTTCIDISTGAILWSRSFGASQTVPTSDYVSKAAPTPAVDGRGVYIFFESGDLIALDHEGTTLWQRSLVREYGPFKGNHGIGASLAALDDSLIVLVDHDGPSYLLNVEKASGANRWKVDREARVSWSSPIVHHDASGPQILISSNGLAESFDARTGRRLWVLDGLAGNTVASPSAADGLIIIGSSESGSNLCVEPTGDGRPQVRWRAAGALASFASPLIHRGLVYYVNKAGVATCVDLASGSIRWSLRLPGSCWASPIAAGNLIYFFGTSGQTVVIRAGADEPVKVAQSQIEVDGWVYSVGAVDGLLLVRTGKELIAVAP